MHENQIAIKDCLKKSIDGLALMQVCLFLRHGAQRGLLRGRFGMKDIVGSLLKTDEFLCFGQK